MQADGGEAVEVRKHEGLAEGTNEEDGRHGLRGCSEVGELVRMRRPWPSAAGGLAWRRRAQSTAIRGPMARGDPSEAVRTRRTEGAAEGVSLVEQGLAGHK